MRSDWQRTTWFLAVLVIAATPAWAQPATREESNTNAPVTRTITTVDGWRLPIDYYHPADKSAPPAQTQNTPAVILLHGADGNRLVWRKFATQLQRAGYAAIAVDLRKHGESQPPPGYRGSTTRVSPDDYAAMAVRDLGAVKAFLLMEHQDRRVNIRKTSIVAADNMVPVAMTFTIADWMAVPYPDAPTLAARTPRGQDIRAIAMLSPSATAGHLNANQTSRLLSNDAWLIAAWIGVGAEDRDDEGTAQVIYDRLTAGRPAGTSNVVLVEFDKVKVRGTELLNLRGENVEGQIITFLNDNIKVLEAPWRTRVSRLE